MWRKEDGKTQPSSEISTNPVATPSPTSSAPAGSPAASSLPVSSKAVACISQGIRVKGEITGGEDLFVDGQVEGKIALNNSVITLGPNSVAKAEISGREIVVRGRVVGKLTGSERIQIWNNARIEGDLKADRIAIEEGAEIRGQVEIGRQPAHSDTPSRGNSKKADGPKSKDLGGGDEKASSGAALAGAD